MDFFKGYIITLMLIFSIPAAYGGISIGGGTSVSVSSDASAQGGFAVNADYGISTMGSSGDVTYDEYHYVTDTTGKHAEVMAHVVNGLNIVYGAKVLPKESTSSTPTIPRSDSVSAQESLTADAVDTISVSALASNNEGDTASVESEISGATNLKYDNYAKATTSSAEAKQSASLDGNAVTFYRNAQNAEGDQVMGALAVTEGRNTVIDNGHGISFSNSVKSTKSSAESSDAVAIVIGCDAFYMGWVQPTKKAIA